MTLWPLALGVALIPGMYRWWMGRRFERSPDDPIQAERWLAYRTRASYVTFVAAGMSVALAPNAAVALLPIVWLASTIGGFRVRRAVFGEAWTLPLYVAWTLRLVVGVWGFWILLGAAPWLEIRSGSRVVAIALAVGLLLWQHWYVTVLLTILRARPFDPAADNAPLAAGFARVLGRTNLPRPPGIWRAGPPESMLANAVAIPSLTRPSVLFSNALVGALTAEETTAILGHEVAHLEDYNRRRWALRLTTPLLVLLTTLVIPRLPYPEMTPAIWALVLAFTLSARAQRRQGRESESDRRAVELCGDWQALSSALIALHSLARVPRRWSEAFEQRASHPSLARRLAALRAIGGAADAPITATVVAGSDGSTWVTIEPERVRHLARVPAGTAPEPDALAAAAGVAVTTPYPRVRELRVMASGPAGAAIRIRDVDGGTWTCAVSPADVPRIQVALDGVDHLINHAVADTSPARVGVLASTAIALAGVLASSPALAAIGILTALVPSRAASAAAAAGVIVVLAGHAAHLPWISGRPVLLIALLAAAAIVAAVQAVRWHGPPARRTWILVAVLAASSLTLWAAVALVSASMLDAHQLLMAAASAVALPAACAAALWTWPGKRIWAAAITLLTGVAVWMLTPQFVTAVIGEPLMASGETLRTAPLPLRRIASTEISGEAMELRITPDGRRFIVALSGDDEEPTGRFVVGTIDGEFTTVEAIDVEFVNRAQVLMLTRDGAAQRVSLRDVATLDRTEWDLPIAAPQAADLLVNPDVGRWRVTGRSRGELVRIEGTVGGAVPVVTRWPLGSGSSYRWLLDDSDTAIAVSRDASAMIGPRYSLRYLMNLGPPLIPGSLYSMRPGQAPRLIARSSMSLDCATPVPARAIACMASDRHSTSFWMVRDGGLQQIGVAPLEILGWRASADGRLAGWNQHGEIFVDQDLILRPGGDAVGAPVGEWTSAGGAFGVLSLSDDSADVTTYERTSSAAATPTPGPGTR